MNFDTSITQSNHCLNIYYQSNQQTRTTTTTTHEIRKSFSGFIGLFVQHVSPVSVAPTIILLGISLTHETAMLSSQNWYFAFL